MTGAGRGQQTAARVGPTGGEAPVETAPPNVPELKPAFPGQTRAPAIHTRTPVEVTELAGGLDQPWALAFLPDGRLLVTEKHRSGKVGGDLTLDDGRRAARMTALSILATLDAELGDLDRIRRIIRVFGMVNVAPGFERTPQVIDGCSDLLVDVFGDAGRHTRTAVGLAELPFGIAVEIELVARIDG